MNEEHVAVLTDGEERTATLARCLGLPLVEFVEPAHEFILGYAGDRLAITWNAPGAPAPLTVDFSAPAERHRWCGQRRRGLLARAIGARPGLPVVDATAGLGRDTFVLAALGCEVLAVERHRVAAALLEDGVRRARASGDPAVSTVAARIRVAHTNACELLDTLPEARWPAVVYLDPMYGERRKSALPKKEMQLFRALIGPEADDTALLASARSVARARTVVKRHPHASPLAPGVGHAVTGVRVRFDVYLA